MLDAPERAARSTSLAVLRAAPPGVWFLIRETELERPASVGKRTDSKPTRADAPRSSGARSTARPILDCPLDVDETG